MFAIHQSRKHADPGTFFIDTYSVGYSLKRLTLGVDNIDYDVYLSPGFHQGVEKAVFQLVAEHSRAEEITGKDRSAKWIKLRDEFKHLCRDVMIEAINQAKLNTEIEIDFLAQTAMIKMLIKEVRHQYEALVERVKNDIRKAELSPYPDLKEIIRQKEVLSNIQHSKKSILLRAGKDLFRDFIDVQTETLKEMREANFGTRAILPAEVFSNPLLHLDNLNDDLFMAEEYVLLGHRFEDLNSYGRLFSLIRTLYGQIDIMLHPRPAHSEEPVPIPEGEANAWGKKPASDRDRKIDGWIKQLNNIDRLFDYFQSRNRYKRLRKQKGNNETLRHLKKQMAHQKYLLDFFYQAFQRRGLLKFIVASYEMQSVYQNYCPPLSPHQILQFLVSRKERKRVVRRINRLKGFYGKSFTLTALRTCRKRMKKTRKRGKEKYLIRYLKDFCRYYRDLENFKMLKEGMERVNLVSDEKTINLSRANQTLYEFLLPHEQVPEEKPIINHVIIKADVRGSTDLTCQMKKKGLNPGSYFSLNFFEPITSILYEYGANKVFIEGDALILSIFEHRDKPGQWYSVARACGLAIQMLFIVKRYNTENQKNQLPKLELGIGIAHYHQAPTFLFDGDNRIMLSPAINLADRLSGCSRSVRRILTGAKKPFNLYVFQTASDRDVAATVDDLSLRYNLNGIELSASGFEKLSQEIELKTMTCSIPDLQTEEIRIHTGKFPTVTGKFKRLVIREDQIPEVLPEDLGVIRLTLRKYYEVCTHPRLYEYVKGVS